MTCCLSIYVVGRFHCRTIEMPNSGTLILNNMIGRVIDLPDLAIGQFAMWHTALNSLQWSDPGETMRHPVVCVWYAGRDNASFLPPPSRLGLGLSVFAIARRCLTQVI
jgi:hypothetical protein